MKPDCDVLIVYVACADRAEARAIGQALVAEGLAACCNLRAHESIYRWNGQIETGEEIGLLIKTAPSAWDWVQARITALHSYDTPAIFAWAADAPPDTRDWMAAAVQPR